MSERLNTQDLIDLLVNRQGMEKKEVENFIKEFFLLIEEGLEKDKFVKIKGLGTFKLIDVESRESVNVNTGKRIEIQEHTKISFIPDAALRDIINKPFGHFETVVLNDGIDFNDMAENVPEIAKPKKTVKTVKTKVVEDKKVVATISEEPIVAPPEKEIPEKVKIDSRKDMEEETSGAAEEITVSTPPKKKEKEPANNKILTIVVVLTILCCGILLFFTYYSDIFPEKKKPLPVTVAPPVENEIVTDSIPADSTEKPLTNIEAPKVEKPVAKPATTNAEKRNVIPFSRIPVNSDSTSYEIIGTKTRHTVREGETLIRISYRYYGTKDLWPYLVMHNRSIIRDPNSLPLGIAIDVPELKKR